MTNDNDIKEVQNITADEAKEMMKGKAPEDFLLLDVRYDQEYEAKHLPGARLIAIDVLEERLNELESEKDKMAIVYCAMGGRSFAGANILLENGFKEAYNLEGGAEYWDGLMVYGTQDKMLDRFKGLTGTDRILALAWAMEEGSRRFYETAEQAAEGADKEKFSTFKNKAADLQASIDKQAGGTDYRKDSSENAEFQLVGGQQPVDRLSGWAEGRDAKEILEYVVKLEASNYDIYRLLEMDSEVSSEKRNAYAGLSAGKKKQLDEFTDLI